LDKADLPAQLCEFTLEVLRTEAAYAPGRYDLVHGHYWLSGQVGAVAKERWGVPLVQSMHTLGRVKNAALARGDIREPEIRLRGGACGGGTGRWRAGRRAGGGTPRRSPASWPGGGAPPPPRSGPSPRGWTCPCSGPGRPGTPGGALACPPRAGSSCSPAASSRSRPRTWCCTQRRN